MTKDTQDSKYKQGHKDTQEISNHKETKDHKYTQDHKDTKDKSLL